MGMPTRRVVSLVVVGLLIAALAVPIAPAVRVMHQDRVIAHWGAPEGAFSLTYVHSIDRLPIEETLAARDGEWVVLSTRIRAFGAGMGQIEGQGTGRAEGQWWVVEDIDRPIGPELLVRVGAERVDHRVRVGAREVRLSPCLSGEQVRVEPSRMSVIAMVQEWARHSPCPQVPLEAGDMDDE